MNVLYSVESANQNGYHASVLRAALEGAVGLCQLGLWALLVVASLHLLRSAWWAFGRPLEPLPLLDAGASPTVTVQLPLRNERYVAERLLRAVCALDWPRARLQVQVLDDSDDETRAIVDRVAAELRAQGHDVEVVRRDGRRGYKAGALAHGLPTARGELVAILDADCVPPPDLLRRLVPPLLADEKLAFAQARWSFDNESAGLLQRVQALILHGLFLVEQPRLSAQGKPLQFNGTSGVWRRAALKAAGGWLGEPGAQAGVSVTEDLDLSFRLQLAGFRGLTLPSVAVQTELPSTMAAFRAQQQRWVRGSGEVLRALGRRLLAGAAPPGARATMLGHLLRHLRQPYLVLLGLWLPAVALGWLAPRFSVPYGWTVVLVLLHLSVGAYYAAALSRLGRSPLAGFFLAPFVVALSVGLSLQLARALLAGVVRGARNSEFIRTPKSGGASAVAYRPHRDRPALLEALAGFGYLALAGWACAQHAWLPAVAYAFYFAFGYLWVAF